MKRAGILVTLICCSWNLLAQDLRWQLRKDDRIEWLVKKNEAAHTDQIEMSGKQVSLILTYGTDSLRQPLIEKKLVFPMLRIIPNDTHGSLSHVFEQPAVTVLINDQPLRETPVSFSFNGVIAMESVAGNGLRVSRSIFPSADKAAVVELCVLRNTGSAPLRITIPAWDRTDTTEKSKSVYGEYLLNNMITGAGNFLLEPGGRQTYAVISSGRRRCDQPYRFSPQYELVKRQAMVKELMGDLVLRTPNDTLNRMFAFAKIRAAESIFDTKNGLMHGPGGGAYYAAIWANDQAEYINPFFPFLGYAAGNESALNSFRIFASFMNPDYKPIPSSVVAEGTDIWNGAGDRGDQAMIAYGASRFALAYADRDVARELWPLIEWCLEFSRRKKTADGVVGSDTDEMEGRFATGKINLSTNVLAYGALVSAAHLATALGKDAVGGQLSAEAVQLKKDIEKYFGASVQGFNTYRYYAGNEKLRSWIGLPLVMGMFERKDQTLKALFSPYLWTKDGMLSEAGSTTFWDRSLLYALRGALYAGATDSVYRFLSYYSAHRLLGEHVPYAIEAWPEGNQRHLSAESALYCRLITEGLFGITPTGFNSFSLKPGLPAGWNEMVLENIKAFGHIVDLQVQRVGKKIRVRVKEGTGKPREYLVDNGSLVQVTL